MGSVMMRKVAAAEAAADKCRNDRREKRGMGGNLQVKEFIRNSRASSRGFQGCRRASRIYEHARSGGPESRHNFRLPAVVGKRASADSPPPERVPIVK